MSAGLEHHPWNAGFSWLEHDGPFRTITPEQARTYDTDGYFVIEDAFDADVVAEVVDALAPLDREVVEFLRTRPDGRFDIAGIDTVSITLHPALRSTVLRDFCAAPLFADLCLDLVGPDARLYWDQAVYKQPRGAEPVLWHQDNGYTYVEPQAYLTCWVALTDATPDNGCVRVVPGLHREGTLAHRATPIGFECFPDDVARGAGAVAVPVRAGSVIVFSSLTPHATGHNATDDVRKAYILQYAPDGAVARRGDPSGPAGRREPQTDPHRQFLVASDGRPVRGTQEGPGSRG